MSFGEHDENLKHSHVHVIACYHTVSNRDQYLDFVSLVSGQLKVCPLSSTFWGRFPACKHLFTFNAFANEFCIYIPFIWNLFLLTCHKFYCSIVLTTTVEPNTESNKKNENERQNKNQRKTKTKSKKKAKVSFEERKNSRWSASWTNRSSWARCINDWSYTYAIARHRSVGNSKARKFTKIIEGVKTVSNAWNNTKNEVCSSDILRLDSYIQLLFVITPFK